MEVLMKGKKLLPHKLNVSFMSMCLYVVCEDDTNAISNKKADKISENSI